MTLPSYSALEVRSVKRKEAKPRARARDKGEVVPLGVEIDTELNRALEAARTARKWSRRTYVEEALRLLTTQDGFPPSQGE